ncbi:unnamed protein product, partial [Polarella glacialis]
MAGVLWQPPSHIARSSPTKLHAHRCCHAWKPCSTTPLSVVPQQLAVTFAAALAAASSARLRRSLRRAAAPAAT